MMRRSWLGVCAVLGCAVSEPNPGHCFHARGDAFCVEEHGQAAPFCALGSCAPEAADGCVAQQPARECWSPCGQGEPADELDACEGIADTGGPSTSSTTPSSSSSPSTTASATTEMPTSTTSSGCVAEDCNDPMRPVCGPDGICVACSGADDPGLACSTLDPARPVCDGDRCVACTRLDPGNCGGITPICDLATNECVGCRFHDECPDSACDLDQGACLDGVQRFWVDGDAECPGNGTEKAPFCLIQDAIDSVGNGASAIVIVAEASAPYTENLDIIDAKTIVLLAGEGRPVVEATGAGPTLSISGAATTGYVEGLRFQDNNASYGVVIAGATAVLDRVESVRNLGGGLGVSSNANARVRNCIFGADANNVDAVMVDSGATLDMVYTTVLAGGGAVTPARALACDGDVTVTVRNSFFATSGSQGELSCEGATLSNTAGELPLPGSDNEALGPMQASWYEDFIGGDFRLGTMPPDALLTTALWQAGDPPVDIDGDARPTRDGTADVAGADE
jgi:hypothetical protein